jgi:hypothetical protein
MSNILQKNAAKDADALSQVAAEYGCKLSACVKIQQGPCAQNHSHFLRWHDPDQVKGTLSASPNQKDLKGTPGEAWNCSTERIYKLFLLWPA